ncbi:hypothetical protein G4B88_015327 [Cannabis sativa]|uniref:Uncharacterized protein n=1 Tax=Cannabis sativa TaxID=3483 RepID=A0A7J6EC83_CANSA|nr:hypothetical protein G4B88_015327 [Cannabis sativa]
MATEVLRPQDCLIDRIRVPPPVTFSRRRNNYGYPNSTCNGNNNYYYGNSNGSNSYVNGRSSRNRLEKPEQRRSISKRSSSDDLKTVKLDKVTILRRGESLDSKIKSEPLMKEAGGGLAVCGTQRIGPEPKMVPKRVGIVDLKFPVAGKVDVYAGSAFAFSPAPGSLPLPSFSKMKQVPTIVDDSATRDLRRLLRIE